MARTQMHGNAAKILKPVMFLIFGALGGFLISLAFHQKTLPFNQREVDDQRMRMERVPVPRLRPKHRPQEQFPWQREELELLDEQPAKAAIQVEQQWNDEQQEEIPIHNPVHWIRPKNRRPEKIQWRRPEIAIHRKIAIEQSEETERLDMREDERKIPQTEEDDEERPQYDVNFAEDHFFHHDDTRLADDLRRRVRILCFVLTTNSHLIAKTQRIKDTWGKRCTKTLYFSEKTDLSFPTIGVVYTKRDLEQKMSKALRYIYEHHSNDAEWFLKASFNNYVIVENVHYFLSDKNHTEPLIYYGETQAAFLGNAGYIVSKETLARFYFDSEYSCPKVQKKAIPFGWCMNRLGVKTGNANDKLGRPRFHQLLPINHINRDTNDMYSLSDYAMVFNTVSGRDAMYGLEYLVYHLRPYGVLIRDMQDLNG